MKYRVGDLEEYFSDKVVTLDNQIWYVESLINEHILDAPATSEAVAVFRCLEVEPNIGTPGILKVRASIPDLDDDNYKPEGRKKVHYLARQEVNILSLLTKAECSSAPKLLASKRYSQTDDMWDPTGYVMLIMMEQLPGISLQPDVFWKLDRQERDRVREAFREALTEVGECGVLHWDEAGRNILWDKEQGECYLVDFESSREVHKGEDKFEWTDAYWCLWELSHRFDGPEW